MTGIVKSWLQQPTRPVRWIEFEAYARRVFANDTPEWYRDAAKYAAGMMQAQGVVGSECLSIDLLAPFLERHPQASTAEALVEALGDSAALQFIEQALGALLHRFEKRLDVWLKLRLPFDLLCAGDAQAAVDFNELDDVATATATLVRRLADKPLAGIVLEKIHGITLTDDEVDAYEPLVGAARHYGWMTALAMPAARLTRPDTRTLDLDVLLLPQVALDALTGNGTKPRFGGGLDDAFWNGRRLAVPGTALLFGTIPVQATPESVIDIIRSIGVT